MIGYLKHKRATKKHPALSKSPVLSPTDEQFLQQIVEETPPPLPERHPGRVAGGSTGSAEQVVTEDRELQLEKDVGEKKDEGQEHVKKENKRWSFLERGFSKKGKKKAAGVQADGLITPNDATNDEQDLSIALENLNLAAEGNSAFSLSKETRELVQKFTVVLKDLVNGVPTAYDDLVKLLDDSSSQLQKTYSKMPSHLQKLVTSLPTKLTSSLGPEVLAAAAESQGLHTTEAAAAGAGVGLKAAAGKAATLIPNLKDLVTKPGAVIGMLKAIMNVLKLRWPAFIGTNVLLSLGLFVLLFVFWYCHKRGKEVRLERENSEREARAREDGEPSGTTPATTETPVAAPESGSETQHENPTKEKDK